ncbi:MAG TPA: N-methyl-L-tryptophan oxidase, partial [Thermodesulfobacteriota bacterium]
HEVLLVEQFEVDHDRGSSYGDSRVTRLTYHEPIYTAMMVEAYRLWEALQAEADELLQSRCGILVFGKPTHSEILGTIRSLEANGVPYERLDAAEVARRLPQFRLDRDEVGIWQADGGFLRPSRCVRANVRLARAHGATLLERTAVTGLSRGPSGLTLELDGRPGPTVDRVVVTAGPWASRLLAEAGLPLTVTRQVYVFLRIRPGAERAFEVGRFPVWLDAEADAYGFPAHGAIPGVKLAFFHAHGTPTDPDRVDREVREEDREPLRAWARRRLPDLTDEVTYEKVCLYTNTPDLDFVIGTLPEEPRVVYVAGLSGHGFKFTVLLGRIAADLALGLDPGFDLSRFSPARFSR